MITNISKCVFCFLCIQCPENVPADIFAIMTGLLRHDPTARLSIPALYTYLSENGNDSNDYKDKTFNCYEPGEVLMVEQFSPPISMGLPCGMSQMSQCAKGNFEMLKEACSSSSLSLSSGFDMGVNVFPVAASIMDRYNLQVGTLSRQLASEYIIEAVHILAQNTIKPDWYPTTTEQTRAAIMDILYQLNFEL
jgi:hypothetical protein